MRTLVATLIVAAIVAQALFTDEAGNLDWSVSHIGGPVIAVASHVAAPKVLFVATGANVVAALNERTGELLWRQLLDHPIGRLIAGPAVQLLFVVSEDGRHVHALELLKGRGVWEIATEAATDGIELLDEKNLGIIVGGVVTLRDPRSGELLASKALPNYAAANVDHLASGFGRTKSKAVVILAPRAGMQMTDLVAFAFSPSSLGTAGLERLKIGRLPTGTPVPVGRRVFAITEGGAVLALIDGVGGLRTAALGPSSGAIEFAVAEDQGPSFISVAPAFGRGLALVERGGDIRYVQTAAGTGAVTAGPTMQGVGLAAFAVLGVKSFVVTAAPTIAGALRLAVSGASESSCTASGMGLQERGQVVQLFAFAHEAADGSVQLRALASFRDDSLALFKTGTCAVAWDRSEALADVTSTVFAALPAETHTQAVGSGSWLQRLGQQVQWARDAAASVSIASMAASLGLAPAGPRGAAPDTRDAFGLRQAVIFATAGGSVVARHSTDGHEIWSQFVGVRNIGARLALIARGSLRLFLAASPTSQHASVLVLGALEAPAVGTAVIELEPWTGAVITARTISATLSHAFALGPPTPVDGVADASCAPGDAPTSARSIVGVFADGTVQILSRSCAAVESLLAAKAKAGSLFAYSVDRAAGTLSGLRLRLVAGAVVTEPTWQHQLGEAETVAAVAARSSREVLAGPSVALPSGGVRFKYVNPNLLAVVSVAATSLAGGAPVLNPKGQLLESPALQLLLLDTVSGVVLHQQTHLRATGPVALTVVEHSVLFSYWSVKDGRHEVAAVDLWESELADHSALDNATLSAFDVVRPAAETQAYVLPYEVVAMGASMTRRGLAGRLILMATRGQGIFGVEHAWLDARRSQDQSVSEALGVRPYFGRLPLSPMDSLSYTLPLAGMRGLESAPCDLESQALVCATGLDLFCTRVTPSGAFDMLGTDFAYGLLVLTFVVLSAASLGFQWLVKRKALAERWL